MVLCGCVVLGWVVLLFFVMFELVLRVLPCFMMFGGEFKIFKKCTLPTRLVTDLQTSTKYSRFYDSSHGSS